MKKVRDEQWLVKSWRPMAAYVYLFICLTDFVFMPAFYEYSNHKARMDHSVELALKFDGSTAQIEALKEMRRTQQWEPITLQSTGLFHMAFGAILGVAAWTRGQEKIVIAQQDSKNGDSNADKS